METVSAIDLHATPAQRLPTRPTDTDTDTDLIRSAQAGDLRAFEVLVARYGTRVHRWANAVLHNDDDADDVAQDAMLVAWSKLSTFRGDCAFTTWLYPITTHLALNKATRRRPTVALDEPGMPTTAPGPDAVAQATHARSALMTAIGGLPAPQRTALTLRHFEGLSYADIATATASTVAAVRSHLFRGRRNLAVAVREWR